MLHLGYRQALGLVQGRGEVGGGSVKDVGDAQGLQTLPEIRLGGEIKLGHGQMNGQVLPVFPVAPRAQKGHGLAAVQQVLNRHALAGQQQPEGAAVVFQGQTHGAEGIAPVVGSALTLVQEVTGHVPGGAVEGAGGCGDLREFVYPFGPVVDRRSQGQHRLGAQFHPPDLVLQQPAGLVVKPGLQRLIHGLGPHFALVGGRVVGFSQPVQGGLGVGKPRVQPQGAGQNGLGGPVVPVLAQPHGPGLGPQGFDGIGPQQAENLGPALAVGDLCQHPQGEVDVQRRIGPVFRFAGEELPERGREEVLQAAGIALGLLQSRPGIVPGIAGRFVGVPVVFIVRVVGIGGHLGIVRLGQGRDLEQEGISRAGGGIGGGVGGVHRGPGGQP